MLKPVTAQNIEFDFWHTTTFALRGLLIAFLLSFVCLPGGQGIGAPPERPGTGLPATAEHDIAPWDGPAFNVWIPVEKNGGRPDSWINVRIWKEPGKSKTKFVFPDETMKIGAAIYYSDLVSPRAIDWQTQPRQSVKGWVRFSQVNSDQPILGEFEFVTENAIPLKGRFEAQWLNRSWLGG
jgi:hypothetical protein